MERWGPESLMVRSRQSAWGEGLALAPRDPAEDDVRVLAARLGPEADADPRERSAVGALVLRAHAWLRGRDPPMPDRTGEAPAALWAIPAVAGPRRESPR